MTVLSAIVISVHVLSAIGVSVHVLHLGSFFLDFSQNAHYAPVTLLTIAILP